MQSSIVINLKSRYPGYSRVITICYEDQNEAMFPDLDELVTPKVGDKYVHRSIMLPHGYQVIYGTMKACKQENDGKPIGCQSDSSILDRHLYDVQFLHGEVPLLTANAIAQAMYA